MNSKPLDFNRLRLDPLVDHIKGHEPKYLIFALFIPVIILLSLTLKPMMTLQLGQTIQLQTLPVDPTDLFRGDYIDLFYDMTQVDIKETAVDGLPSDYTPESIRGKDIYVILAPVAGGTTYQVSRYSMTPPSDPLYLKGQIRYAYLKGISPQKDDLILNIDFGIDRYFIEENSGAQLDLATRSGKVLVTLKVYKGFGVVTNLEIQK